MADHFDIPVPTLMIDPDIARHNIVAMVNKFRASGVRFRPHFKTHQSRKIGKWFRELGVNSITTSSLQMASYFARDGWADITVAFPVNLREIERINALAQTIQLNLLAESPVVLNDLGSMIGSRVGVFIKVDVGTQRTGLGISQLDVIDSCVEVIASHPNIQWKGFLAHAGHTYAVRHDPERIAGIYASSMQQLRDLHLRYCDRFPDIIISFGDTPGASILHDFSADEMRPGNFVFYDLMQQRIGSCTVGQIAVAVICPVVAVHPSRGECVIYGGAIHLSKEGLAENDKVIYGEVYGYGNGKWNLDRKLGWVRSLSQEHGIVRVENLIASIAPGDLVAILPVHSCLTAQCMGEYLDSNGVRYDHFAAGK